MQSFNSRKHTHSGTSLKIIYRKPLPTVKCCKMKWYGSVLRTANTADPFGRNGNNSFTLTVTMQIICSLIRNWWFSRHIQVSRVTRSLISSWYFLNILSTNAEMKELNHCYSHSKENFQKRYEIKLYNKKLSMASCQIEPKGFTCTEPCCFCTLAF